MVRDPGVNQWPSSMSVPKNNLIHYLDLTQARKAQAQAPRFDIDEDAADVWLILQRDWLHRIVSTWSMTQILTLNPNLNLTLTLTRRCDLQLVAFFLYHYFRTDRTAAPAVLNVRHSPDTTRPALLPITVDPFCSDSSTRATLQHQLRDERAPLPCRP